MIIDPPVSPHSSVADLEACILRLEEKRERLAADPEVSEIIRDSLTETRRWLRLLEARAEI